MSTKDRQESFRDRQESEFEVIQVRINYRQSNDYFNVFINLVYIWNRS